jgi:glyoxylase-like metal-dependent hydrolase (beta-lactamase superfamily II)
LLPGYLPGRDGVFKGTTGTGDLGAIEASVDDIAKETGGKLALVVMTHRHADHIAGFSRCAEKFAGKVFAASAAAPKALPKPTQGHFKTGDYWIDYFL